MDEQFKKALGEQIEKIKEEITETKKTIVNGKYKLTRLYNERDTLSRLIIGKAPKQVSPKKKVKEIKPE